MRGGIDRSQVRGLAIFACSAEGLWEVIELPVRVTQPRRREPRARGGPARGRRSSEHEPIGVLMADRQRARMFVFELGELVERSELFDEPTARPTRASATRASTRRSRRRPAPRPTCATPPRSPSRCARSDRFQHLAIATPDDLAADLEASLHPYLREPAVGPPERAGRCHLRRRAGRGPGRSRPRSSGGARPRLVERLRSARRRRPARRRRASAPVVDALAEPPGRDAAGVAGLRRVGLAVRRLPTRSP